MLFLFQSKKTKERPSFKKRERDWVGLSLENWIVSLKERKTKFLKSELFSGSL
jgi:hypothetical protein